MRRSILLPAGVTIDPFYDRTDLVQKTIKTVATNLIEGGLLVVIVLFIVIIITSRSRSCSSCIHSSLSS